MDKVIKVQELIKSHPDDPLIAVEEDKWDLIFPDTTFEKYKEEWNGDIEYWLEQSYPIFVYKTVSATTLFNQIIESTYIRNDPGIQFTDIANKTHLFNYGGKEQKIRASNPCVTADTWVLTSTGPRKVKHLLSKNAETRAIVNGKPYDSTPFWQTGEKEIFELTTDHGYKLEATANHIIKTTKGNVELQNLSVGDVILLSNHQNFEWSGVGGNFEQGWLIGSLIGDGHIKSETAKLEYWDIDKEILAPKAIEFLKQNFSFKSNLGDNHNANAHNSVRA